MSPFKAPTKQDTLGAVIVVFGMALALLMHFKGTLTTFSLVAVLLLVAFGAYLVLPTLTHDALKDIADGGGKFIPLTRTKIEQSGRRETDPVVVTTEVEAVPNVEPVAPPRPIQPELAQRPPEARPGFEPLMSAPLDAVVDQPTTYGEPEPAPKKERRRTRSPRVTVQSPGAPQPPSEHEPPTEGYEP